MQKNDVITEIEDVFLSELGTGSVYILQQKLQELGLTRETFERSDVNNLVEQLLGEYSKLLGGHVSFIKKEINRRLDDDKDEDMNNDQNNFTTFQKPRFFDY